MKRQTELDALKVMETELYKVQAAYTKARNEHYESGKAALETVRNSMKYTYTVTEDKVSPYSAHYETGLEAVKVSRVWTVATTAMIERFNAEHPQHALEPNRQAMTYYRTSEGILNSYGGGYAILDTPCLCNDEQWMYLKAGIVPVSFIH